MAYRCFHSKCSDQLNLKLSIAIPSRSFTPFSLCGLKARLTTSAHSHGKSKYCRASALRATPKTVLGGSKLNVTLSVVPSVKVAVTVMVLALANEAAPVRPLVTKEPMKMDRGSNEPPGVAEIIGGLFAGELRPTAKLQ